MKKSLVPVCLLLLLSSCFGYSENNLDPSLKWVISSKNRFTETSGSDRIGLCNYTLTDGKSHESFVDSCNAYSLGKVVRNQTQEVRDSILLEKLIN